MKKILLTLGIVVLCLIGLLSSQSQSENTDGLIEHFEVSDNPFDDGSGLVLKWKPLPKEQRIIQYRIYRGISPDSLFHLSSIDVDPALGVIGDELSFYDKDYQVFFDLETAPRKLKKENYPEKDHPLYSFLPRDPKVIASLIPHYVVLGAIKNKDFYYRSRKVVDADSSVYAGYRVNQFSNMFANPMAGKKYYYTVAAVNERGKVLTHAGIKEATPVDNRPDTTTVALPTYVTDNGNMYLNWTPPANSTDIYMWEGWLMPKSQMNVYRREQEASISNPNEGEFVAWQAASIPLFQVQNDLVRSIPEYYHHIDPTNSSIKLPADMQNYDFVLGMMDFSGLKAYTLGHAMRFATQAEIPSVPKFSVKDKENDKGDALVLSVGKPIAYATQAIFVDKAKRKLKIGYELGENKNYQIGKLDFRLKSLDGNVLSTATEHFMDKSIICKLPAPHAGIREFDLEIELHFQGNKNGEESITTQRFTYDDKFRSYTQGGVFTDGINLSKKKYDIGTLSKLDHDYFYGKRSGGMTRQYDDILAYEDVLYKQIIGIDAGSKLCKLSPSINIAANKELGELFTVPLYRDEFRKQIDEMKASITKLKAEANSFGSSVPDSLSTLLTQQEALYKYITESPEYLAAEKQKSDRGWLKSMVNARLKNARTVSYRILASDGKGLFAISEPYQDKDGKIWNFPISNWFDFTKIPTLIGTIILCLLVLYVFIITGKGRELYIRPIAGLAEIDNSVGRATEMGRPVMFVPGWGSLGEVCTIASMMILNQIARKTAEFDVRLVSPHCDYMVVPMAQEMVKTAYSEIGRPDSYNQNDIFFVSDMQFAFSAAVNGITVRERAATIFYMGYFNAEALLMTETGNQCGAIQIAATDAITQIPFFITTCDYTLIGEEFYAASAYLSQDRDLVSIIKAQDYYKFVIVFFIVLGVVLSSLHFNALINALPIE